MVFLVLIVCASFVLTNSESLSPSHGCDDVKRCLQTIRLKTYSFVTYSGNDFENYVNNTLCNASRWECAQYSAIAQCRDDRIQDEAEVAREVARVLCTTHGRIALTRFKNKSPCFGNEEKFRTYLKHKQRCEGIGYNMYFGDTYIACRFLTISKECDLRYARDICGKTAAYLIEVAWVLRINLMFSTCAKRGYFPMSWYNDIVQYQYQYNTLDRLKEAIRRKRPGLLRRGVVLQHDNATPNSADLTQQWLQRYRWEILT
ncbi:histone-lysine N-methyltransferase SETMAR [Plakobranchus ocellatus]|uniref:Histone-lysine N-methyltransferase SETMAR n=1 Tax=Plakobranchus ocellatus TaxID=259542 RepID=A0AAV4B281_9GAST|nr:histone-lysine N-methyltransferase SETMAR [Plakobranchus ocellatus]